MKKNEEQDEIGQIILFSPFISGIHA